MSQDPGEAHAGRCLVPRALRGVFKGVAPRPLLRYLKLPPGTLFETLEASWLEVGDPWGDRRLLILLTAVARRAINPRRLDLSTPAFPEGVAPTTDLDRLPLHNRTRHCLENQGLFSVDALQRQSLGDLLEIPGFGAQCLVDLLTAVEAANRAAEGNEVSAGPTVRFPELAATLSPRLTYEARLLGSEPWSHHVSLFDVRLGFQRLKDDDSHKDVAKALPRGSDRSRPAALPRPSMLGHPSAPPWPGEAREGLPECGGFDDAPGRCDFDPRDILGSGGFGSRSMAHVLGLLDVCRLLTPATVANDRVPSLADFCRAVVTRTNDSWFSKRLADRIRRTRAEGIRCLSLSVEEELRGLAASVGTSRSRVEMAFLGWDGKGPHLLKRLETRKRLRKVGSGR